MLLNLQDARALTIYTNCISAVKLRFTVQLRNFDYGAMTLQFTVGFSKTPTFRRITAISVTAQFTVRFWPILRCDRKIPALDRVYPGFDSKKAQSCGTTNSNQIRKHKLAHYTYKFLACNKPKSHHPTSVSDLLYSERGFKTGSAIFRLARRRDACRLERQAKGRPARCCDAVRDVFERTYFKSRYVLHLT